MGDVISLSDCRQSRQDKWLSEVNVLMKARFSITHLDAGWSPPIVAQHFASGLPPREFVEQFSKRFGLMEK